MFGEVVELEFQENNYTSYLWSTNSSNSSIIVNTSGTYSVVLTDENLCEKEFDFIVADKDNCEIIVMPNVFTPNGDLTNDSFVPLKYAYVPSSHVKIFNRWGTLVSEYEDIEEGWNGKHFKQDCSEGAYYWLIEYQTNKGVYKTLSGYVNLFR